MRKAKVAALIFGGVSTCIFGGLLSVCATAPVVSTITPSNDVQNIYDVESDELANVAAVTSIRTTPITTTSNNFRSTNTLAASPVIAEEVTTTAENRTSYTYRSSVSAAGRAPSIAANKAPTPAAPTAKPVTTTAPQETVTEPATTSTQAEVITTTTTTTTEAFVPETTTTEIIVTEPVEEPTVPFEEEPIVEEPTVDDPVENTLPISDEEYIILCNAVAHEAGCHWISEYDKALVVEVIMNRVNSPLYPNTILGVLTQPYQFSGSSSYVYLGKFTTYVSDSVKEAVELYFSDPDAFDQGYFGFYGDGYRNYFY